MSIGESRPERLAFPNIYSCGLVPFERERGLVYRAIYLGILESLFHGIYCLYPVVSHSMVKKRAPVLVSFSCNHTANRILCITEFQIYWSQSEALGDHLIRHMCV